MSQPKTEVAASRINSGYTMTWTGEEVLDICKRSRARLSYKKWEAAVYAADWTYLFHEEKGVYHLANLFNERRYKIRKSCMACKSKLPKGFQIFLKIIVRANEARF